MQKAISRTKKSKKSSFTILFLFFISLGFINSSFAEGQNSEDFPWELFYPALIKKAIDKDHDGFTIAQGDCNDLNPNINPNAVEICGDGIDQDCNGEDQICSSCVNISGTWIGNTPYEDVFLNLTQNGCVVSGKIKSPGSCPDQCGYFEGMIHGTVNSNIFSMVIPQDPWFDCYTCELICYGRDEGNLTVEGNKMTGQIKAEDCEENEFYDVSISLNRTSATLSPNNSNNDVTSGKSSFLIKIE